MSKYLAIAFIISLILFATGCINNDNQPEKTTQTIIGDSQDQPTTSQDPEKTTQTTVATTTLAPRETCDDGILNQNEVRIDCGGVCPTCDLSFDSTAECIAAAGAVFYTRKDCNKCQAQIQLFKASLDKITYVNCDTQRQRCLDDGVRSYPSWMIGGKLYKNPTIKTIQLVTGCGVSADEFDIEPIEVE